MTRASVENCVKDQKRWCLVFGSFLSLMFMLSVEEKEFSVSHIYNCELSPQKTWSLTSFMIKHLEACNFLAKRQMVWGNVYITVYLEWNGNRVYTKCILLVFTCSSMVGLFESLPIRAWAHSQTSTLFWRDRICFWHCCFLRQLCILLHVHLFWKPPPNYGWSAFFRPLSLSFCRASVALSSSPTFFLKQETISCIFPSVFACL